jgi:ferredoxin
MDDIGSFTFGCLIQANAISSRTLRNAKAYAFIPKPPICFHSGRKSQMNVTINRTACVSCGACWNTCPELFDQNPCDSCSEIVRDHRFNGDRAEGVVPDCFLCCVQEAADLCPVHIIRIS